MTEKEFENVEFTFSLIKIFVPKKDFDAVIYEIYNSATENEAFVLGFFDKVHYVVWRQPFLDRNQRLMKLHSFISFLRTKFSKDISCIYGEAIGLHGSFGCWLSRGLWVWFNEFEQCLKKICTSNPGDFLHFPEIKSSEGVINGS